MYTMKVSIRVPRSVAIVSTLEQDENGIVLPSRDRKVPILDSPCSINSDGSSGWNGIPRVRRKWIDVVEGKS